MRRYLLFAFVGLFATPALAAVPTGEIVACDNTHPQYKECLRLLEQQKARADLARGNPTRINDNGGHVQWVYYSQNGATYIYFKNGLIR